MPELVGELEEMDFCGERRDRLLGLIGLQEGPSVSLIRHLSVRPAVQREGVGTALLELALDRADSRTVLVGKWAADWAIAYYEQHGFENPGTDRDLLDTH